MKVIDEIYTKRPFYGSRRIRVELNHLGYPIGRKHTSCLMKKLGIEAVYPKKKTSVPNQNHKTYPYLLRDMSIENPNQVWSTDITYIRLAIGFVYLVAVIDWFSRFVLAWELSITMEKEFCIEALKKALEIEHPEIFNSDQGSQFTSPDFVGILEGEKIKISMDGRGRCHDNIFVERLWRNVKYEEVYLKQYSSPSEARKGISEYFQFYNYSRPHQSLNYKTPAQIYFKKSVA